MWSNGVYENHKVHVYYIGTKHLHLLFTLRMVFDNGMYTLLYGFEHLMSYKADDLQLYKPNKHCDGERFPSQL